MIALNNFHKEGKILYFDTLLNPSFEKPHCVRKFATITCIELFQQEYYEHISVNSIVVNGHRNFLQSLLIIFYSQMKYNQCCSY